MITKRKHLVPIFEYPITIIIFDNWEELKNHIPEELFKVPARGITIDFEDYCVVCCTPKYSTSVVHEAGHIKNLIWKYIGYTPMVDNDEVDQYLHTYIYEVILKALNKHLAQ
jgi:hypothetical protein